MTRKKDRIRNDRIQDIDRRITQRITSSRSEWKTFLEYYSKLYRFTYNNILLMYGQKPYATLMADYESWIKAGRQVKSGSKGALIINGIEKVIPDNQNFLFDISETVGSKIPEIWEINEEDEEQLKKYLRYPSNSMKEIIENLTRTYVRGIIKGETDKNPLQRDAAIRTLVFESVCYMVGCRCGCKEEFKEIPFYKFDELKDMEVNTIVGTHIAHCAGEIRLPDTAFRSNAGTDVTADIIFLQKRNRVVIEEPDWIFTERNIPNDYIEKSILILRVLKS
ncbi:MAG TPA: hypothetical protein VHQ24_05265 [Lachnospiraceae bacterium]|nr:hypothetical protein [Lachnospiraceae bacterium]